MSKFYTIIFGLTADPIHKGHEQAIINGVEYCHEQGIQIKQFVLVPVYQPNLIADKNMPVANFKHRIKMCELVAKRLSKQLSCTIQVSEIEKQIVGNTNEKNYSYNTIKRMIEEIPTYAEMTEISIGMPSLFMVSADHFTGRWPKFRKWYKWQELLKHSGLLINLRPNHKINIKFIEELRVVNPNIFINDNENIIDISSTEIRDDFEKNNGLSKDVKDYICKYDLY